MELLPAGDKVPVEVQRCGKLPADRGDEKRQKRRDAHNSQLHPRKRVHEVGERHCGRQVRIHEATGREHAKRFLQTPHSRAGALLTISSLASSARQRESYTRECDEWRSLKLK